MTRSERAANGLRTALIAGSMAALLSACSAAPDWAKPINWWGSDEPEATEAEAEDPAVSEAQAKAFPELADVPERPDQLTSAREKDEIADELRADKENAAYTNEGQ